MMKRSEKITLQLTEKERCELLARCAQENSSLSDCARRILFAQENAMTNGEALLVAEVARLRALLLGLWTAGLRGGMDEKAVAEIENQNRAIDRRVLGAAVLSE